MQLAEHVAQWDADQQDGEQLAVVGGELHTEQSLLASGTLSKSLQDWLVDVSEIEYLVRCCVPCCFVVAPKWCPINCCAVLLAALCGVGCSVVMVLC